MESSAKAKLNATSAVAATRAMSNPKPHGNGHGIDMMVDLRTLSGQGRLKEALNILNLIGKQGKFSDSFTYVSLLDGCVKYRALTEGKLIHAHIILTGFKPDVYLQTRNCHHLC